MKSLMVKIIGVCLLLSSTISYATYSKLNPAAELTRGADATRGVAPKASETIGLELLTQGQFVEVNQWYSEASPFEQKKFAEEVKTAFFSYCSGGPQCAALTIMGATVCNNFRPTCYWVR